MAIPKLKILPNYGITIPLIHIPMNIIFEPIAPYDYIYIKVLYLVISFVSWIQDFLTCSN